MDSRRGLRRSRSQPPGGRRGHSVRAARRQQSAGNRAGAGADEIGSKSDRKKILRGVGALRGYHDASQGPSDPLIGLWVLKVPEAVFPVLVPEYVTDHNSEVPLMS
jgi:hypothetical protein